jgi:4-amino-4-deoxy-L-arabinose transferase
MLDRVTRLPPAAMSIEGSSKGAASATVLVVAVLLLSFSLKLHGLGHLALRGYDESFHAVVAQNLIAHPFLPTLYDRPFLPVDSHDWRNTRIWLHKGIVPLWQMAASMALLGHSTFALRLPSAVLGTAAAGLTYLIGLRLMGRWAAAIAAILQAFNPATWMLTQGLSFSDHIDIALLFWTELAIYLMFLATDERPLARRALLALAAGVAQGLAFNCKSYPALIALGIAAVAWLAPKLKLAGNADPRLRGRDLLWMIAGSVLAGAPWLIYCAIRFGPEFRYEQLNVLRHLTQDVEGWAGPWDRVIFDYLLRAFGLLYPTLLAAIPLLVWRAWRPLNRAGADGQPDGSRDGRLVLLLAWFFGAVVPMVLATSKTPSATLLAWPAGLLLLGALFEHAARGDFSAIVLWLVCGVLACVASGPVPTVGLGYSPLGKLGVMRENIWVVREACTGLLAAMAAAAVARSVRRLPVRPLLAVAGITTFAVFVHMAGVCWRVTLLGSDQPAMVDIGHFVEAHMPANTAVIVQERQKLEHMTAMFYCDRSAYALDPGRYREFVRVILAKGGLPVLLSRDRLPLRVLMVGSNDWKLYACDIGEFPPKIPARRRASSQ